MRNAIAVAMLIFTTALFAQNTKPATDAGSQFVGEWQNRVIKKCGFILTIGFENGKFGGKLVTLPEEGLEMHSIILNPKVNEDSFSFDSGPFVGKLVVEKDSEEGLLKGYIDTIIIEERLFKRTGS